MQIIYDTSDTHEHNQISRLFSRSVIRLTNKKEKSKNKNK